MQGAIGMVIASTPGKQTVPRAEAWAPIAASRASNVPPGAVASWYADASYVTNGIAKLEMQSLDTGAVASPLMSGANGDLWVHLKDYRSSGVFAHCNQSYFSFDT